MSSPSSPAGKLRAREICVLALMGGLIFATKAALAAFPNINLNTPLIILTVIFFGWRAMYSVAIYVLLEGLVFGFSLWWFSYLYAWPLLVVVAMLFRRNDSVLIWAVVAGVWGLLFGPVMYVLYLTVTGWQTAFALWVAGIPYDLTHCAGNFVFTLALYRPLYRVMAKFLGPPQIPGKNDQTA